MKEGISRPAWIEIDLVALRQNIKAIKSRIGGSSKLMAVVKADAYGHGAVEVSKAAADEGVDYLGVAMIEEANDLMRSGVNVPITLLYPETVERSIEAVRNNYCLTLSDIGQYDPIRKGLGSDGRKIRYFLKINTGMNRYGMKPAKDFDISGLFEPRAGGEFLGVTTNMAGVNGGSPELADRQFKEFMKIMESAGRLSQNGFYYSYEASSSIMANRKSAGSLARVGHLLYGLAPGGRKDEDFKPVMAVKSRIAEIQTLKKNDGVGYGFTYIAPEDMRIAVIPMGYADGYPWALSNKGEVLVRGKRAGVVGRICMDAFMINITDIAGCGVGDEAVIMGSMGDQTIDAHQLGSLAGSFSYEILSGWSRRLPRIYK